MIQRSATLDRFRVLARLDIIAFHLDTRHERMLMGFGLPFFLLTTVALAVHHEEPDPTRGFIRRRIDRLMVPWALWALVHVGIEFVRSWESGAPLRIDASWREVLGGVGPHLWYPPFALFAGLVAHAVHRATRTAPLAAVAIPAGALAVGLVAFATAAPGWGLPRLDNQWIFALPAIPLGYLVGRSMATPDRASSAWLAAAVVAGAIALTGAVAIGAQVHVADRYALALAAVVVSVALPGRPDPVTDRLNDLGLGMYLSHVAIAMALSFGLRASGIDAPFAVELLVVFALSAALTAGFRRVPGLRRFV